ncbi:serine/threonine-protein kinase 19-like [Heterocephalus glaber]|uniref:Serine/threonine-protein kinase 19-like n=1 Tax=Heterocephalus glaber TaxID=10181 RepID=A0AAX6PAM9_HETGA|nr:serine/threonine-protein kinase 19-like [Heterocephalus glaber]
MSQKRHRLVPQTLGLKRRRERGPVDADALRGESGSARAAVAELVRLFPRGLFEDALPPIALRSQVYSLVPDRTAADRQLVRSVGGALPPLVPAESRQQTPPRPAGRSASVGPVLEMKSAALGQRRGAWGPGKPTPAVDGLWGV